MAELTNLIGCEISLISQQDVRYDGRLFSINAAESSIVLQNVQCKGTEDRVLGDKRVLPNPQILPLVSFPGREIKDLYVHDRTETAATNNAPVPSSNPPHTVPSSNPPPTVPSSNPPPVTNNNNNNTSIKGNADHNKKVENNNTKSSVSQPVAAGKPASSTTTNSVHNDGSKRPERGTGDYLKNLRVKGKSSDDAAANSTVFDFQAGLNAFNKKDILNELDQTKQAPVVNKYVKDDFFDSLSCDILDRETGRKTRLNGYEERNLNKDTFGAIAVQSNYYGRGRGGRGGGRGGRFGGRGGRFISGRGGRGRVADK
jgi:protein LSM14